MAWIRLSPSGHEIAAEPNETVLSALERAGRALPNNCRAGACGECKTRVIDGTIDQGIVLSMALTSDERADGYALMCMATPTSDIVEIDYGTAEGRPNLFPPRLGVEFVVVDRIPRTDRMLELRLRPAGAPMRYWPGQYVMLGSEVDGVPRRAYSLASAPRPDGELTLLVTKVEGGKASTWLHDEVELGGVVTVDGPYGTFVGDPATETPVVCLAAGSGLAPILSLADAALRRGFEPPVTIVLSSRTPDDDVAIGLMRWWEKIHPNFRLVLAHTRETASNGSIAEVDGRIPGHLEALFGSLADTSVFIAGGPEFVADCEEAALRLGASEDLIYTEGHHSQLVSVA